MRHFEVLLVELAVVVLTMTRLILRLFTLIGVLQIMLNHFVTKLCRACRVRTADFKATQAAILTQPRM